MRFAAGMGKGYEPDDLSIACHSTILLVEVTAIGSTPGEPAVRFYVQPWTAVLTTAAKVRRSDGFEPFIRSSALCEGNPAPPADAHIDSRTKNLRECDPNRSEARRRDF